MMLVTIGSIETMPRPESPNFRAHREYPELPLCLAVVVSSAALISLHNPEDQAAIRRRGTGSCEEKGIAISDTELVGVSSNSDDLSSCITSQYLSFGHHSLAFWVPGFGLV